MRSVLIACVLALMMAAAEAKRAPLETAALPQAAERTPDLWAIYLGPAGAMIESDYFRAPHGPFKPGGGASCRLDRESASDELRLAYSCRQ